MAKVERKPRQVIENKLLAALDDEGKVAIVASEADIDLLIDALELLSNVSAKPHVYEKADTFIEDLKQLRRGAFGR